MGSVIGVHDGSWGGQTGPRIHRVESSSIECGSRRIKREIKPVIVRVEEYLSMRNRKEVLLEELNKSIVLWEKRT